MPPKRPGNTQSASTTASGLGAHLAHDVTHGVGEDSAQPDHEEADNPSQPPARGTPPHGGGEAGRPSSLSASNSGTRDPAIPIISDEAVRLEQGTIARSN